MTNTTQYKNTPIGPIPTDWEVKNFGGVVKIEGGSQPPLKNFIYEKREGYIRLIQTRDYRTDKYITYIPIELAKKFCKKDDIIIGRYGPPIFQIFKGLEGAYNVALMKAIPNLDIVDKDYTYYFISRPELRSYLEGLSQRSGGQTGVEIDRLNEYPFPLPPLPEQQKIAEVLSTWDKAIQDTDAIIKKLQDRNKALANKLFEENNWQINKLSDLFERITDKNKEGNTTVTTISAKHGFIRQEDFFNKTVASKDLSNYYLINKGDFCYNKSYSKDYDWGVVKRLNDFEKAVVTTLYICFRFKDNSQNSDFWELYFENKILDKGLSKVAQEGGRAHGLLNVTSGDFFGIKVKVPSLEEQNAIAEILNTANQELKQYQEKLTQIKLQKKGLMQQLLTGKVRTV